MKMMNAGTMNERIQLLVHRSAFLAHHLFSLRGQSHFFRFIRSVK